MNFLEIFVYLFVIFYLNYELVKVCSQCFSILLQAELSVLRIYYTTGHWYHF